MVIRSQELRIGNYVNTPSGFQKVIRIEEECFYTEDFKNKWAEIKPILISPQWLNDLRFKKYPEHWGMHKGSVCFHENNIFYKGVDIGVKVRYVHELQNLYFALTGKELKI